MRNINTVKGNITTENMGITLMHEHVFNLYPYYKEKENTEFVKKQIERLRQFNVKTIVDLTPYARIGSYKNLISQCDINLICSMGFFLDKYVPASYRNMSVSDLVITKPGGLTTTESLASGLPLIIIDPLPGQEEENADFIEKSGAGIWIKENDDIQNILFDVLGNTYKLQDMKIRARLIAKKNSTKDICEKLLG